MLDRNLIRGKLIEKRSEIFGRVRGLFNDKTMKGGPLDTDMDDQSIILENKEVVDGLDEIERNELSLIDNALRRLNTKDFGVCSVCGEEIPENRLMALPHTTTCVNCAS